MAGEVLSESSSETLELGRAPCQGLERLENFLLWFEAIILPCRSLGNNMCASSETQEKTAFQKAGELSHFFGQKKRKRTGGSATHAWEKDADQRPRGLSGKDPG